MKPLLALCILAALAIIPFAAGDGTPAVTIGTEDGLVYYQGDTVLFSGISTAGDTIYLFMTAPGLPDSGVSPGNLFLPAETGNISTFMIVPVSDDSSYAVVWDPAMAAPGGAPAGSYTIYASAAPVNFSDQNGTPSASVTIFLLGWPSAVPHPHAPALVTIPPTQTPIPLPTATTPSGSQVPIPPTQEPFPIPTASDPSGTPITIPPTQTPIPLPTPPVPVPLPSAPSGPGPIWPLPIITADFESWSGWLVDQLVNFLIP
ncbi:MAG: hypothetical protein GKC07_09015 [Methanomicrobiales archaeon]|nr:hypothetical protein [Methanomicrobiales archaeon]